MGIENQSNSGSIGSDLIQNTNRMIKIRREYDIAYGCFLFCGAATLFISILISILSFIPVGPGIAGGIGFLVTIPLSIASLVLMVVGVGYTIRLYHHWPLIVLSILSLLFVAEVATEYGPVGFIIAVPILYGVSVCGFSLMWFLVLRKRWGRETRHSAQPN